VAVPRPSGRTTIALAAAAGLAALSLPAGAATTTTPATGSAESSLTILHIALNGETVDAGDLRAVVDDATPHVAKLVVTPLDSSLTGPLGRQTITSDDGSSTIPGTPKSLQVPDTGTALLQITGPTFSAKAVDSATKVAASAVLDALGSVQLLTVPLDLSAASLSDVAKVTSTGASAVKELSVGGLALPSVQDLLASLGVDLDTLLEQITQGRLTALVDMLGGNVAALNTAVDDAQATLSGLTGTSAPRAFVTALAQQDSASTDLTDATAAFDTALDTFWAAAGSVPGLQAALSLLGLDDTIDAATFAGLDLSALQAVPGVDTSGLDDLAALADGVLDAQAILDAANALVDALQDLVTAVLGVVQGNDDPLAALGPITVTTSAIAAKTPKAVADVKVGDVSVLGALVPLGSLTSTLAGVTDTLSGILESVTGVSFTAPTIAVGTPSTSTDQQGRTRFAAASITGVTLKLPSISISSAAPAGLELPGVPDGVNGSIQIGRLAETAQWTPAASATTPDSPNTPDTPGSDGPLPDTGAPVLLPFAGLLAIGAGLALRRRLRPGTES
jgi:hypothetical protein